VNGLKLNGAPVSVVGAVSGFHQLKPNGVCGVGNWPGNWPGNWAPNGLLNGVANWFPNWLPNWLANWEANGELNPFHALNGVHWLKVWFHGVFHELFDQLLVADHGVEFQPWFQFWFHDGLKPLNANGVLNMDVSPLVGCFGVLTALAICVNEIGGGVDGVWREVPDCGGKWKLGLGPARYLRRL